MADFEASWRILCESFPENEHRSQQEHLALLNHPRYQLHYIREDGQVLGFWSLWTLEDFDFIEHIALDSCCRGRGTGSRIFEELFRTVKQPLILEVERPDTEAAIRRIAFYERLGFTLNRYDYIQPAMQAGCGPVPLYLMSWPEPLDAAGFDSAREQLYRIVYGLKGS